MKTVAVVTDSAANLSRQLAEEWDIEVIPLWIQMDDESLRDGVDIQPLEFFRRLTEKPYRLRTSQPPLGEFLQVYQRLKERAQAIISIHVTSRYSGTFQAARAAAAELVPFPIEVVDSGTLAMAQGFVVLAAAQAAAAGASLAEVVRRAKGAISKVDLVATLETLEYVVRGGRLAWAAAGGQPPEHQAHRSGPGKHPGAHRTGPNPGPSDPETAGCPLGAGRRRTGADRGSAYRCDRRGDAAEGGDRGPLSVCGSPGRAGHARAGRPRRARRTGSGLLHGRLIHLAHPHPTPGITVLQKGQRPSCSRFSSS